MGPYASGVAVELCFSPGFNILPLEQDMRYQWTEFLEEHT